MTFKQSFKQFAWVPDGTYDYTEFLVRYTIKDGSAQKVICKAWVDIGAPSDVNESLKLKWGSYPDLPPKPPKKLT